MPNKYREVRAALLAAGWRVVRQRGSHEVWAHPEHDERIVVAGKQSDTVPVGTLGASEGHRVGASPMSEYVVIYEQAKDGAWGAYLPDLPGVVAHGPTREAAADRIREALDAYAEELGGRSQALPTPRHFAAVVTA